MDSWLIPACVWQGIASLTASPEWTVYASILLFRLNVPEDRICAAGYCYSIFFCWRDWAASFLCFFLFYTFHTCKDGMASIGQFGDWSAIISMILLSKMAFLRDCFVYCRFFSIFFCVSMQSDGYILR